LDLENKEKGKTKLPKQFEEIVRPDLIKRAVLALQSRRRQPYGAKPGAGQRHSAKLSRRRRDYRGSYGLGISRVPRKIMSRRGMRMNWVGAVAPGTVGGRRAHPPKAGKGWENKINKKENKKAIRSGLAATVSKVWAERRGHKLPDHYPLVMQRSFEEIESTKKLEKILAGIGIQTSQERRIRQGKGKSRGRKYKATRGALIVVSKDCPLMRSSKNLLGLEVCDVKNLNAEMLAPGCQPGRITIYTESSLEVLDKERLFT